jgi:hypothetical protein
MHKQLQAIITVLSLINPAICAAMFARAVAGQSLGEKVPCIARTGARDWEGKDVEDILRTDACARSVTNELEGFNRSEQR